MGRTLGSALEELGDPWQPPNGAGDSLLSAESAASQAHPVHRDIRGRIQELVEIATCDYGLAGIAATSEASLWRLVETIAAVPELRGMISQAFISLVFEGELQIEWGYPGHYLEVELRSDGTFRTMAEFDGATQTSTLLEPEQVIGMLRRLGLGSAWASPIQTGSCEE